MISEEGAHFAVIVDNHAYEYNISFEPPSNDKPTAVVAEVLVVVDDTARVAEGDKDKEGDDGLGDAVPDGAPAGIFEALAVT